MNADTFKKMRNDVAKQWRTFDCVDHDEAVQFCKSINECGTFHKRMVEAKKEGNILIQPRCGVPLISEQIDLMNFLKNEGQADLLSVTIDSYTRQNRYYDVEESLKQGLFQGVTTLNGMPLVNHGVNGGRKIFEGVMAPIEVRHGLPDARLLAEIAFASGFSSFEGGPITYTIPYSKKFDLKMAIDCWRYIDTLVSWYSSRGIIINRESFGPLTGILVPPCIEVSISILEALLMAAEGVKSITLGHSHTGCLFQDVASVNAMRKLALRYLENAGYMNTDLTIAFHQWMGPFPKNECKAFGLIALATVNAVLSSCNKIIVKTPQEAMGVPTKEANASGLSFVRFIIDNMPQDFNYDICLVKEEELEIETQTNKILESVFNEKPTDLADKIVLAFKKGILDVPFAANVQAMGKILPIRDINGAIRLVDNGNLPFGKMIGREAKYAQYDQNKEVAELLDNIFYFGGHDNNGKTIPIY